MPARKYELNFNFQKIKEYEAEKEDNQIFDSGMKRNRNRMRKEQKSSNITKTRISVITEVKLQIYVDFV